jgi:hypothetical protein
VLVDRVLSLVLITYLSLDSVQEILLSKAVTIILSGMTLDWEIFGRAITNTVQEEGVEDDSIYDRDVALKLHTFWWLKRWDSSKTPRVEDGALFQARSQLDMIWELIYMQRRAQCADKRDRIYSLLGLLNAEHDFTVDYEESASDLFWRAGEYFDAWFVSPCTKHFCDIN